MAKSKAKGLTVNVSAYEHKQLAYKMGYQLPPNVALEIAQESTANQVSNYNKGFGVFNSAWVGYVKGVLQTNGVSPLQYALYRAFMNEYLKKVLGLGRTAPTMTKDTVVAKFEKMGAKKDVLEAIAKALEGARSELEGLL